MAGQETPKESGKEQGEGSYSGSRDYNKHVKEHIAKGDVEKEAQRAKEALDEPDRDALRKAEKDAKLSVTEAGGPDGKP